MDKLKALLFQYKRPVLGIGVTAFTRTGPAFLLPNYSIICLLETADLGSVRQICPVYSLEKDFKINLESLEKQNTASIMKQKKIFLFLKALGKGTSLLVYKSSKKVEKICHQLGIKILASPSQVRDPFEDKKQFRVLGKQTRLKLIPGETLLIDDLDEEKFDLMVKKYGKDLVFQLTDYKVGGGIGTFFIEAPRAFSPRILRSSLPCGKAGFSNCGLDSKLKSRRSENNSTTKVVLHPDVTSGFSRRRIKSKNNWQDFLNFVKRRREKGKKLVWVNVTKMIKGINASIAACVTRYGILSGLLQSQLVDIAEATAFKGRSGVWCGHDWGWKKFSLKLQKKAELMAQTLGKFMAKKGYQGVFGIDLVVDERNEEVWPVECNSRYTAAFPFYSMMQTLYQEPSFDIFHLLEFLELDYQVDLPKIQALYRQPKRGAHLVLHNQERKWVKVEGNLKGGVYQLKQGELVWQRPGFSLEHLKNQDEFCLVDRAVIKGDILKPGDRLVRVLFRDKIAVSSTQLDEKASFICKKIYENYRLKPIPSRTKKIF